LRKVTGYQNAKTHKDWMAWWEERRDQIEPNWRWRKGLDWMGRILILLYITLCSTFWLYVAVRCIFAKIRKEKTQFEIESFRWQGVILVNFSALVFMLIYIIMFCMLYYHNSDYMVILVMVLLGLAIIGPISYGYFINRWLKGLGVLTSLVPFVAGMLTLVFKISIW
jgi:hypothetical protein